MAQKKEAYTIPFRQISFFAQISEKAEKKFEEQVKVFSFKIGQTICSSNILSANVFLILQGECRLIGYEDKAPITVAKMGKGNLVGLASILRGKSCENVTASTDLLVAAIPDQVIIDLYRSEPTFKETCNKTVWVAEVYELLLIGEEKNPQVKNTILKNLTNSFKGAQIVDRNNIKLTEEFLAITRKQSLYIASNNSEKQIGEILNHPDEIPSELSGPFELRIISLPEIESIDIAKQSEPSYSLSSVLNAKEGPAIPEKSSLQFDREGDLTNLEIIRGSGSLEEIMACFQMLSSQLKLPFRSDQIERVIRDCLRRGQSPDLQLCGQLGASLGLHVQKAKVQAQMGTRLQTPCLIKWKDQFVLAINTNSRGVTLASPRKGKIYLPADKLEKNFEQGIEFLSFERTISTPEIRFGPEWFLPALTKYRGVLLQVLVSSFVVQLFGLANPLLIQVIIDKVISQRSLDTLQILGIALIVVTLLEGVLGSLRTFLFTETTNRIDQRLGAEVIDHLLRLPLNYFDRRPVGELSTRLAELEKIRSFLTGTALTTLLDALFSVIYIVVMAFYSWLLTIVALIVVPLQVIITLLGAPLFRRQFRQAAQENAKTQSHLVEVLTGIQTVKAQNVEMVSRWKWQEYYSAYISRTFEKTVTGTAIRETGSVFQKLSQLLVLWVGAALVLRGELSLGQLIAFRIISGYVTQPLLRLSSIWQNIQELRVSFERLADIVDTPIESAEADQAKIPLPPLIGNVKFENVTFGFSKGTKKVLRNINLEVESGSFVGIVGQSGSGKSTLMKLMPRLYSPDNGRINIDDYDIDKVELYSLRRQIGIVPQDPLLFSGTVAENISLTNPNAGTDEIVRAAKLACAHEFIMDLPKGYSTNVGERGGQLSGGQRQRVAIARTLLNNPKLLILDEATSALDYETERKVSDNLLNYSDECTIFFITHRLSTIRRADRILLMHQGSIVESGTHENLMKDRGRYYALLRQQEGS